MLNRTILWLDDIRDPNINNWLDRFSPVKQIYDYYVIWVKSYKEFKAWIDSNGLPAAICFDHDLGDIGDNEKTGYDCAKYLVQFCMDNGLDIHKFGIQSSNGPGADNIKAYLLNYIDFTRNHIARLEKVLALLHILEINEITNKILRRMLKL